MQANDDFKPNKRGLYGITYLNTTQLTKQQIVEKFSIFDETPNVHICNGEVGRERVFVNFKLKENALKARDTFQELRIQLQIDDRRSSEGQRPTNPHYSKTKGTTNFGKKSYNSKDDSDNQSSSSTMSLAPSANLNRRSRQNSTTSIAESVVNGSSPGLCEIPAKGQNLTAQKNNYHDRNNGSESKVLTPSSGASVSASSNHQNSSDVGVEASDKPPVLVNGEHQKAIGDLQPVETTVVVLSNLPPWSHAGHIFKIIHDASRLQPVEIEVVTVQKRALLHYAYVHFENLNDAEFCIKCLDNLWCENRRLICILVDELMQSKRS